MDRLTMGITLGVAVGLVFGIFSGLMIGLSMIPEVSSFEQEITDLNNQIINLETEQQNKNQQISTLQNAMVNKDAKIAELLSQFEIRSDQVANLQLLLSDKDYEITNLTEQVSSFQLYLDNILAQTSEVIVLNDKDYYFSIKNDLHNASTKIILAMYSINCDPFNESDWGSNLVNELIGAKDRGVNVTVTIEFKIDSGYLYSNLEAYNYLLENNVHVELDMEPVTDHRNLVIVDNEIVYIGSHNWGHSELYLNRETSVKILSENVANTFIENMETF